jgi:hypothetical protein
MSERLREGWRNCSRSGISPSSNSTTIRSLCTWTGCDMEHSGQGAPLAEEENEVGSNLVRHTGKWGRAVL